VTATEEHPSVGVATIYMFKVAVVVCLDCSKKQVSGLAIPVSNPLTTKTKL